MRNTHSRAIFSGQALGLLGVLETALFCAGCGDGSSSEPRIDASTASVELCRAFDSYTAAIAERTIECRRTIGPQSFRIDEAGNLARAFDRCASGQADTLRDIDDLLSVQRRDLPDAKRCIASRFQEWSAEFERLEIHACPAWEKLETIGAPTRERLEAHVAAFGATMSQAVDVTDMANGVDVTDMANGVADQHENYRYRITPAANTEGGTVDPVANARASTLSPAETAAACAGGFAGFVLEAEGDRVLGDPALWLSSYVYPAGANPFLETPNYCHRMSFFGPLPGNIYAHRNRVGECCTRYVGAVHVALRLELDCLDTEGIDCVATCI